jgi:hypothetical protein
MTINTHTLNVFDVAWPTFAYQDAPDPEEAHNIIRWAQQQAPIALGPYGPEVLSYDLVRTVLRDSRFAMPRGISLVVQGISSGPVWDKVCQTLMSARPPNIAGCAAWCRGRSSAGCRTDARRMCRRHQRLIDQQARPVTATGSWHRPAIPGSDHLRPAGCPETGNFSHAGPTPQ